MTAPDLPNMPQVLNGLAHIDTNTAQPKDEFTTSNGIKFKLRSVPPLLIVDAQANIRQPVPPKVYIKDKDTHEENPDDPEYRRATQVYIRTTSELANSIYLTRGTKIISVPDGIDKYEESGWAEDIADQTGLEIPESGNRRYFCWLKYVALVNISDFTGLAEKIMAISGVTREAVVAEAADRFRDNEAGDASVAVHTPEAN